MNALARTHHRSNSTTSHRPQGRLDDNHGDGSMDSRRPLGSTRQPRATDRLGATRPNNSGSELSALTLWNPQDADIIGRSPHGLRCSAFTEALTGKIGVSWIRAASPDAKSDEAFYTTLAD